MIDVNVNLVDHDVSSSQSLLKIPFSPSLVTEQTKFFLQSYSSSGHGENALCVAISFLEQHLYFSLSALASVSLSLKRDEKLGSCRMERKSFNCSGDEIFFYEEYVLLNSFLLGLDLLTRQYEKKISVRIDKCHQKKVRAHQITTEIVIPNI